MERNCFNCANCLYIGEGDSACMADESDAEIVLEDFQPTEDFLACGGSLWEED